MFQESSFMLFLSLLGADDKIYVDNFTSYIKNTDTFKVLQTRMQEAKEYNSLTSIELVKDFNSLNFNPQTLIELYDFKRKVEYLYENSDSSIYLNPLLINEQKHQINSIGDLKLFYYNRYITFNDLVDLEDSLEIKTEAIKQKCQRFFQEYNYALDNTIEQVKRKYSIRYYISIRTIQRLVNYLIFIFTIFSSLAVFFSSNTILLDNFFRPKNNLETFSIYFFLITSFVFSIFFILHETINSRFKEKTNFFRRFIHKKEASIYLKSVKDIAKLQNYIIVHIREKTPFPKGDFELFKSKEAIPLNLISNNRKDKNWISNIYIFSFVSFLAILALISSIIFLVISTSWR